MKRAVLYARVSGDDRGKDGRNLAGQLEMCREYAQGHGYTIVAELQEDDRGASGARIDLPELSKARDLAQAGKYDVLVVREIDRLSRNLAKQLIVEEELKRAGVGIEYVLGEYPDTPEGRLNKHIKATIAEYEREKITERNVRGRRRKVQDGHVMVHGNPPYGYRLAEVDGKKTFVIHEDEARIVRLVFTWFTKGDETGNRLGAGAIANKLTEMSIPTWKDTHQKGYKPSGYGQWSLGTISHMLNNEAYAGRWHYGRRNHAKSYNPRSHWITVKVPAIISQELWDETRARRAANKAEAKRNTKRDYLLGRRAKCIHCGQKAYGNASWSQVTKTEKRCYQYYTCAGKLGRIQGVECNLPSFRAEYVDATVWDWVCGLFSEPELFFQGLQREQERREQASKPLYDQLAITNDLLTDNRAQLERALDLYLSGEFPKEMLTERKERLQKTIDNLEQERAKLTAQLEAAMLTDEQVENLTTVIRETGEGLDLANADFEKQRWIIERLNLTAKLEVVDGEQFVHVECVAGYETLPIVKSSIKHPTIRMRIAHRPTGQVRGFRPSSPQPPASRRSPSLSRSPS